MSEEWTPEDIAAAARQGWGVFNIWDADKCRLELEIQYVPGALMRTDEMARQFIRSQTLSPENKLANKAARLVFTSKVGTPTKTKRKRA